MDNDSNKVSESPVAPTADIKTEVAKLAEKKETAFAKKQAISSKIASSIGQIKEHKAKRDELTKLVKEKKEARDALNAKIKDLIAQLKLIVKDAPQPKPQPSQSFSRGRRNEGPQTPTQLKADIKTLQYKIETEGMSFDAEQKMMKLIKEKKKLLEQLTAHQHQTAESRELSKQIDDLKAESDKIHEEIQHMARASQQEHESIISISKSIDDMRVDEKQALSEGTALKQTYKEKATQASQLVEASRSQATARKEKKRAESIAREEQNQKQIKQMIEQQAVEVEHKIKNKKKLTTADLLVFQAKNDSK